MPEQPPPTTRILRAHSGLPSSSRRSEIFFAAVSVSEIMNSSLGSVSTRSRPRAQYSKHVRPRAVKERIRHRTPPWGSRVISSSVAPTGSVAMSRAASAICSVLSMRPRSGGAGTASQSGVSVAPADRTPTLTPWGRISSASTREKPRSPYLVAVYAALPGRVRLVTREPMLMMVPRLCAIMAGSTARHERKGPAHERGQGGLLPHVGRHGQDGTARRFDLALHGGELARGASGQHHLRAFPREGRRHRAADAPARSRDEGHLAGEPHRMRP